MRGNTGAAEMETTMALISAWDSLVFTARYVKSTTLLEMLYGWKNCNKNLLAVAKQLDQLVTALLDKEEAAINARAAADRPAAASGAAESSNPFDDFDQILVDNSSGNGLGESFDAQLADGRDEASEERQNRCLETALSILACVSHSAEMILISSL
jgi:hypothetical protein